MTSWNGSRPRHTAPTSAVASVVVPAHDEEPVLGRCLRALLADARPGEFDVIVVANACQDATADVARELGVRVIETSHPGKAHALRIGDAACRTFPRAYLDADTELTAADLRILAERLHSSNALGCAPTPVLDLTGVGPIVARAHHAYDHLIASKRGLAGPTVYMLSKAGHRKVFPMPDVIGDDGWVHRRLSSNERIVVSEARCTVRPARTVAAAARRRARVRIGNRELDAFCVPDRDRRLRPADLADLVRGGRVTVVEAACLLLVHAAGLAVAAWRMSGSDAKRWSADRTSRVVEEHSPLKGLR